MKWNRRIVWRLIILLSVFVLLSEPVSTRISKTRSKRKEHKKRHSMYKLNLRKVYVRNAKRVNASCLGKFMFYINIILSWLRIQQDYLSLCDNNSTTSILNQRSQKPNGTYYKILINVSISLLCYQSLRDSITNPFALKAYKR